MIHKNLQIPVYQDFEAKFLHNVDLKGATLEAHFSFGPDEWKFPVQFGRGRIVFRIPKESLDTMNLGNRQGSWYLLSVVDGRPNIEIMGNFAMTGVR